MSYPGEVDATAQQAYESAQQEAHAHYDEVMRRQAVWQIITGYGVAAIDAVCEWALGQGTTEKLIRLWFYEATHVIVEVEGYKIRLDLNGAVSLVTTPKPFGAIPPGLPSPGMSGTGAPPPAMPTISWQSPLTNTVQQNDKQYEGLPNLSDTADQTFWDNAISALAANLSEVVTELTSNHQ